VSICSSVLCQSVDDHNTPVSTAADYEPRTKETRANRNVTTKTVSAEPLAVEDPSTGVSAGYSQQIRYAIAPTRAYHDVSPAPDCA